ncbi:MAG: transposase, partial [Planctomycetaceae bacterium]|jgi:SRSO17 transposase|nr:transposase [Planctomycetaceae bacterium]
LEPYFRGLPRSETRENATTFVKGLLSDLRRKNTESIAYRFGKDRRGLQCFLGEVAWDDLAMRNRMVSQVVKLIGEEDGILAEYEVQSWIGWHHHVTLCLLATWFLTKETIRIKKKTPSMTVPTYFIIVSEQLRHHATRTCPNWVKWTIEKRSLRREYARFYHYKTKNRLPKRHANQRI